MGMQECEGIDTREICEENFGIMQDLACQLIKTDSLFTLNYGTTKLNFL